MSYSRQMCLLQPLVRSGKKILNRAEHRIRFRGCPEWSGLKSYVDSRTPAIGPDPARSYASRRKLSNYFLSLWDSPSPDP